MGQVLPLDKMTTADKLRALEEIWDDLLRDPENIPSPAWHGDVLEAREKRVKEGNANFTDWAKAKRDIRDKISK